MKAIVCDKCGKVVLLAEETYPLGKAEGIHCLILTNDMTRESKLDLCQECAEELLALVRKEN